MLTDDQMGDLLRGSMAAGDSSSLAKLMKAATVVTSAAGGLLTPMMTAAAAASTSFGDSLLDDFKTSDAYDRSMVEQRAKEMGLTYADLQKTAATHGKVPGPTKDDWLEMTLLERKAFLDRIDQMHTAPAVPFDQAKADKVRGSW